MGNNTFLFEEQSRQLGSFMVGRLLPFREKRMVGPFCFIDHMGPATIQAPHFIEVDQHPHIGLCTLTYLLEGEMEHRDSTGAQHIITPGSVNLMVSGKGVSHTERTPQHLRNDMPHALHGYQVWIALPKEMEHCEPSFHHIPAQELPVWRKDGVDFKVIAGSAFGHSSPTPHFSPLFMVEISALHQDEVIDIHGQLEGEIAVVVVRGAVYVDENAVSQGQLLISQTEHHCHLKIEAGSTILLFGGQALPEPRYMFWNFVSSSKEHLNLAKERWKNHDFPKVPGDDTYVPMP
jgi:redox-sensitive bicupin YhaK (pirin superfamily)